MATELPSPYDYLDYRRFLADWFERKQAANKHFSYRLFARLAGQKSPSLLLHVIAGERNLTPQTTEAFVQAMGLRAGEARFFGLLVELGQAPTPEARAVVWDELCTIRRFREARRRDLCAFEYLSNRALPTIRELVRRSDFREEPAWIAAQLRPEITVAEAAAALETLLELGLLVREDGALRAVDASVSTPTEVTGLAVRSYHRGMIQLASESIDRFPGKERHLLAVTVGVPDALVPVLKAESNAFLERMMHLCDASEQPLDRIMQLNLQLFPLTNRREEPR